MNSGGAEPNPFLCLIPKNYRGPVSPTAAPRFELVDVDLVLMNGLADGYDTAQLAKRVGYSAAGVNYRIAALCRQYDCSNRTHLIAKALRSGLI